MHSFVYVLTLVSMVHRTPKCEILLGTLSVGIFKRNRLLRRQATRHLHSNSTVHRYPSLRRAFAILKEFPTSSGLGRTSQRLISNTASSLTDAISTVDDRGRKLVVRWPDGFVTSLLKHHRDKEFLSDHCRCPDCFHPVTKQRLKSLVKTEGDLAIKGLEVTSEELTISWASAASHQSRFPLAVLRSMAYDPPASPARIDDISKRILWGSDVSSSPPTVQYNSLMPQYKGDVNAEKSVLHWLDQIHTFGISFVEGVPATPEDTERLVRRISHIRETHYGKFWDFTSNMSHGDLAYSSEGLSAHTDTTYFTDPAGLQIFHLLAHPSPPGTGGKTLLVDGFRCAALLAEHDPESYSQLSRLKFPSHASGTPGSLLRPVFTESVLRHNAQDQLLQVRWNNEDRGVIGRGWNPEDVPAWYKAARRFDGLLRSEESEFWVQLTPGTVVVIDNWRVLHGRSAFTGSRRMCGAYVGADDWRSRRAALRNHLQAKSDSLWEAGW